MLKKNIYAHFANLNFEYRAAGDRAHNFFFKLSVKNITFFLSDGISKF